MDANGREAFITSVNHQGYEIGATAQRRTLCS